MELYLKVSDDISIELNKDIETLLNELKSSEVNYRIVFNKTNKKNDILETIIQIPELNVELSLEDNVVKLIKAGVNKFNKLEHIDSGEKANVELIKSIEDKIISLYKFNRQDMYIQRINIKTAEMVIIIKNELGTRRIHIMSTLIGDIYINNIAVIG